MDARTKLIRIVAVPALLGVALLVPAAADATPSRATAPNTAVTSTYVPLHMTAHCDASMM